MFMLDVNSTDPHGTEHNCYYALANPDCWTCPPPLIPVCSTWSPFLLIYLSFFFDPATVVLIQGIARLALGRLRHVRGRKLSRLCEVRSRAKLFFVKFHVHRHMWACSNPAHRRSNPARRHKIFSRPWTYGNLYDLLHVYFFTMSMDISTLPE